MTDLNPTPGRPAADFEAAVLHGCFHGDVHAGNLWAPDWAPTLARGLYLVRNGFPDEVAKKAADEGIGLPG